MRAFDRSAEGIMASGHVNRTNRPNTWLHRPACGREESPCQLGAVHTWHLGSGLGDIQTEYALCELGNFHSAGRVDRCCTAAGDTADRTKPGRGAMTKHKTGTREEWLTERLELLKEEKELTRRSDDLARRRQELPWVRIDKQYRFDTDEGSASLKDLFRGRSQLLVYHFMFGPDYKSGCPSCSAIADGFDGFAVHLANHDVTLSAVSRAPLAKLQA